MIEEELNELLGDSDDEQEQVSKQIGTNEPPSSHQAKNTSELDELLGDSDSDKDLVAHSATATGENIIPPTHKKSELDELLGHDDSDEDEYAPNNKKVYMDDNGVALEAEPDKDHDTEKDKLAEILGTVDSDRSPKKVERVKTKSKMRIPPVFRVPHDGHSIFVRTPNFIKIQPAEFDARLYNEEKEREQCGSTTSIVRWRVKQDEEGNSVLDDNGKPVLESNARMIEFEDGSMQLIVGDAIFQCKSTSVDNCYAYEQQQVHVMPVNPAAAFDEDVTGDDDTGAAAGGAAKSDFGQEDTCLGCIGDIRSRLVIQPSSLDSDIHTRMTMKITEKYKKERRIQDRDYEQITENPEKTLALLAKQEAEEMRREKKSREQRQHERNQYRRPMMTADYLDDNYDDYDDFGEEDAGALKKSRQQQQQGAKKGRRDYYMEEEDDDGEMAGFIDDDDDDDEGEDIEGESDGDSEEDDQEVDGEMDGFIEKDDDDDDDEGSQDGDYVEKKKKKNKKEKKDKKKKSKKEKKGSKRDGKSRTDGRDDPAALSSEQQQPKQKSKRDRDAAGTDTATGGAAASEAVVAATAAAAPMAIGDDDDEDGDDENVQVPQRKRVKRAIVASDDEDED